MNVFVATSKANDGSMKPVGRDDYVVKKKRVMFLNSLNIRPEETTLLHLTYGGDNYTRYLAANEGLKGDGMTDDSTIEVDALVTTSSNHALFLPLADCVGAVIHDPTKNILMLSHLGRHNLEQVGGTKSIEYLIENFDVNPVDVTVWLSPAAGQRNYPLFSFDDRSLHDVASEQLIAAGVLKENITASPIDTTTDPHYFSHSQFLKGNRESDGRFAIVAVMK